MESLVQRLSQSVTQAHSLEELTRPLLQMLEESTHLESTYLTTINEEQGQQRVLYARNASEMQIPEGLVVPWGDTLCKRALEEWLGVELFDRSSQPARVTEVGEWFRTVAQDLQAHGRRVQEGVGVTDHQRTCKLDIVGFVLPQTHVFDGRAPGRIGCRTNHLMQGGKLAGVDDVGFALDHQFGTGLFLKRLTKEFAPWRPRGRRRVPIALHLAKQQDPQFVCGLFDGIFPNALIVIERSTLGIGKFMQLARWPILVAVIHQHRFTQAH